MNKHGFILVLALVLAVSVCACFVVVYATPLKVASADAGETIIEDVRYTNTYVYDTSYLISSTSNLSWQNASFTVEYKGGLYNATSYNGGDNTKSIMAYKQGSGSSQYGYLTFIVKKVGTAGSGADYLNLTLSKNYNGYRGWYAYENSALPDSYPQIVNAALLVDRSFTIRFNANAGVTNPSAFFADSFLQLCLTRIDYSINYSIPYTYWSAYNWSTQTYTHIGQVLCYPFYVGSYDYVQVNYIGLTPGDVSEAVNVSDTLSVDQDIIFLSVPDYIFEILIYDEDDNLLFDITDDPDDDEDPYDRARHNFDAVFNYQEPYGVAYYTGYELGIRTASQNNLVNMTFAALQLPFKLLFGTWDSVQETYIDGLFTITILGVDLRAFVLGILSAVIIVRLLRLIIGVAGSTGGGA